MPNRILREGILTSSRMAKLGWAEEVFYRRLMSVVDDFGRYYADAGLLRAACYPRQLNKVSDPDIGKWLRICVDAALVRVYPAEDGESYLQLIDFRQQARAAKSKYPEPSSECIAPATHPPSNGEAPAPVFGVVFVSVSEDVSAAAVAARFDVFWKAYPKKKAKDDASAAFEKRKPNDALLADMLKAIDAQRQTEEWQKDGGKFIPYPATWLNDARWLDDVGSGDGTSPASAWHETAGGIKRMGESVGIPYTAEDECKPFDAYRKRVFAVAHKEAA